MLDVARVDAEKDLGLVAEGLEEAQLDVRIVAGQAARGVHVVHQLAAELQVELAEALRAAADLLGLFGQVFLVVKATFHRARQSVSFRQPLSSLRIAAIFSLHRPQPPPAFVKFVTSSTVVREFSVMTRRTSFSETL